MLPRPRFVNLPVGRVLSLPLHRTKRLHVLMLQRRVMVSLPGREARKAYDLPDLRIKQTLVLRTQTDQLDGFLHRRVRKV